MPIQVPTLNRNQPVGPAPEGALGVNAPDVSNVQNPVGRGLEKVAEFGVDTAVRLDDQANSLEALKARNEYSMWARKKMYGDSTTGELGLVHQEGDPTALYNNFDKEASEKYNEILNGSGRSAGAQRAVEKALAQEHNSIYDSRLVQFGNQQVKYEQGITDAGVKLQKSSAGDAVMFINPDNPDSYGHFDTARDNIRDIRLKQYFRNGQAIEHPDGDVLYFDETDGKAKKLMVGPVAKMEMKKDFEEITSDAVKSLINTDKLPAAKATLDRYVGYLSKEEYGKLVKEYNEKALDKKADIVLAQTAGKDVATQRREINKLLKTDPELARKATGRLSEMESQLANLENRNAEEIYDQVSSQIDKIQRSTKPIPGAQALQDQTVVVNGRPVRFKDVVDRLKPEQRKAIYHQFDRPEESTPAAKEKLIKMMTTNYLVGMPTGEFLKETTGMDTTSENKARDLYAKMNDPKSTPDKRAQWSYLAQEAKNQFISVGLLRKSVFKNGYTESSTQHMNNFIERVRDHAEELSHLPVPEQNKWLKEQVQNEVKFVQGQGFDIKKKGGVNLSKLNPEDYPALQDIVYKKSGTGKPKIKTYDELSQAEKDSLSDAYEKAHDGKQPGSPEELMKWMETGE